MNNKDYLSQEEIDALLRQTVEDEASHSSMHPNVDDYLTSMEQDALGEIGNITFGSAATALSTLLGKKVDITTPKVSVIARAELNNEFPTPHVAVHVNYVDGFQGINMLVIKTSDAQVIADLMLGGDGTVPPSELNEIHISAVQEAMNQMMGSSATSMSTIFNRFVNISPPGINIMDLSNDAGTTGLPPDDVFIKVSFRLKIGDLIDSSIMQLLPVSFAKDMVSILMGGGNHEEPVQGEAHVGSAAAEISAGLTYEEPALQQSMSHPVSQAQADYSPPPMYQQQHMAQHNPLPQQAAQQSMYQQPPMQQPMHQQSMYQQPPMQPPMYQQPMYQQPMQPMYQQPQTSANERLDNRNFNVQPVQFSNFTSSGPTHADDANLNLLLDIPLKVTVELGRTQKLIKEILEISQGSIIELDKLAGEPVDILVNNKLVAKGEVVVIDENFGVRVTDIVSQWDRIQKLQ